MLRNKLYFKLALAALLTVGFLATSLIGYFVAQDSLATRTAEEALPLTGDNIYSEVQHDLLRPVLISSVMAHDTFVRAWASAGEQDPKVMVRYLKEIQNQYGTVTAFFISDRTHRYYHPTGVLGTVSAANPDDRWYFRFRDTGKKYEITVHADAADHGQATIFVNRRVRNAAGDYLGATGVGLSVQAVTRRIEAYQKRYGRRIYFVNREGEITLHGSGLDGAKRLRERPGLAAYATRILTSPGTSLTYTDADGRTVHVHSRLIPEFNWYLLVEETGHAGGPRMRRALAANLLLSLAITLLVLLIVHFTVRGYQRRLEEMATTDKLTGTANRHVFDLIFDHVIKTAGRREQEPVSLISIDIDHFKRINDSYGHQGGDRVLREVVSVIRHNTRETDTLCRWGGDEFLLLLNDCTLQDAEHTAELIRQAVAHHPIRFGRESIAVTLSLGVAQHQADEDLASLIQRADEVLYEAKRQGRDQVRR